MGENQTKPSDRNWKRLLVAPAPQFDQWRTNRKRQVMWCRTRALRRVFYWTFDNNSFIVKRICGCRATKSAHCALSCRFFFLFSRKGESSQTVDRFERGEFSIKKIGNEKIQKLRFVRFSVWFSVGSATESKSNDDRKNCSTILGVPVWGMEDFLPTRFPCVARRVIITAALCCAHTHVYREATCWWTRATLDANRSGRGASFRRGSATKVRRGGRKGDRRTRRPRPLTRLSRCRRYQIKTV